MASRKRLGNYGKRMFKKVANKTNAQNLVGQRAMMRGGFHR